MFWLQSISAHYMILSEFFLLKSPHSQKSSSECFFLFGHCTFLSAFFFHIYPSTKTSLTEESVFILFPLLSGFYSIMPLSILLLKSVFGKEFRRPAGDRSLRKGTKVGLYRQGRSSSRVSRSVWTFKATLTDLDGLEYRPRAFNVNRVPGISRIVLRAVISQK